MEITANDLRERIALLGKAEADALANANALRGAIQDCEFWLARIEAETKGGAGVPLARPTADEPA